MSTTSQDAEEWTQVQAPPEIKWSVSQVATEEPYDAETFDGTSVSAWNVVPIMSLRIKRLRPKANRDPAADPDQLAAYLNSIELKQD